MFNLSLQIDGWIIITGALCSVAAALLGNFLVLRRMSLMGDAISHAVLPGLAAAFLISGQRQGFLMFLGAAVVGVLTVFMTEVARDFGKVDEGAAIGVAFTYLFAIGLTMIEQVAELVDLDPGCVLYGSIETVMLNPSPIAGIPQAAVNLGMVTMINLLFVTLLYRPLKVSTFDSQLARTQGIPVRLLHYALASLVAITSVAAFESVGNILVVAMFVVPPVTAWLCTDRLGVMIGLSVVFAILSAILGHLSAMWIPALFGRPSTSTAGMMAVASGALLGITALFASRKGLISRARQSWVASQRILGEDLLGLLYRSHSQGTKQMITSDLLSTLVVPRWRSRLALRRLERKGWIKLAGERVSLSEQGLSMAQNVVRSHRLWEHYLAAEVGMPESLIHGGAERLEHYTDRQLRERLNKDPMLPPPTHTAKAFPPKPKPRGGLLRFLVRVEPGDR